MAKGLSKKLREQMDLSGPFRKTMRSPFQLHTRTMRGKKNRNEVFQKIQQFKKQFIKEEKNDTERVPEPSE